MWIQGYQIKKNLVPPYCVQQVVRRHIREMADNHNIPCEGSVHSEACYLYVNDKVVSIRNHPGRDFDIEIQLSDFNSWNQCERHFLKKVLLQLEAEENEIRS